MALRGTISCSVLRAHANKRSSQPTWKIEIQLGNTLDVKFTIRLTFHFFSRIRDALFVLAWVFFLNGCAIHYYDPETGTEHLWGIGHMRMKVGEANEGVRTVVAGTDTLGMAAGSAAYDRYIALGWQRLSRLQVVGEDTAVRLDWPTSDLFSVRVGSDVPPDLYRDPGQKPGT